MSELDAKRAAPDEALMARSPSIDAPAGDARLRPVPPGEPPAAARPLSHNEVRRVIFGIGLAMFLAALNQTIVATALPTIGRDFEDFENLPWIITAFLLTSTAVAPLYGKLSDIHGRRTMMMIGISLFTAGSVLCALAPNMITLSLGRALQGIGGGGIMPLAQIIIADAITPRERGRYQAYIGIIWVSAGIAGPVFGGFISQHLNWSMIFWMNVPLGVAAALLSNAALKSLPRHDRKHQLDLIGAALIVAAAVTLLLGLSWGGTHYPWLSPQIALLFAGAGVFAVLFGWRLSRAPEPFLPLPILVNPVVLAGTMASACAVGVSLALTVYLPLYFQVVHKMSASDSGLALVPLVVMSTPGSILSGRALSQMRHYKRIPIFALAAGIVAIGVLVWWPDAPLWLVLCALSIVSLACGSSYPVSTVCVQNAVPLHQVGTATGVMNFFRALTSAFEVAVLGAILLAGFGVTPERGRGADVLIAAAGARGNDVSHVFGMMFAAAGGFLVLALVALLLMEERPLRGPGSGRPADR
jgi:EmrB/QacA subfamily drug resistance transporter